MWTSQYPFSPSASLGNSGSIMETNNEGSGPFPTGETPQKKWGFEHVKILDGYKVALLNGFSSDIETDAIPVVNLDGINNRTQRPIIIKEISKACKHRGFFQIVNHGIPQSVMDGANAAALRFFNLPSEEMMEFMSNDVHSSIRFGTCLKVGVDNVQHRRTFLKHYANPLDKYVSLWPRKPCDYRDKMGEYTKEAQKLGLALMGAITEGLGLGPEYASAKMEHGLQVIVVNGFPPSPQPDVALGLPPHSDYSCLTICLQSSSGLQIQDSGDGKWRAVPNIHGALQVLVGDCIEVLSNGWYKSVVHRVKLRSDAPRISVASLHCLGLDEKMEAAQELVDEQRPNGYKESSFKDFLDFISHSDISDGKYFIDTLRLKV